MCFRFIHVKLTKISCIVTLFKVRLIQDSSLLRTIFIHVKLTKISCIVTLFKVRLIQDSTLLRTIFIHVKLTKISCIVTLFKVWLIQDSSLLRIGFIQVSLYYYFRGGLLCLMPLSTIFQVYLTLCTFSFEINESSLSDTRCCITTLW
jgi:hypothetical protein